jgi:hypothetical protein
MYEADAGPPTLPLSDSEAMTDRLPDHVH